MDLGTAFKELIDNFGSEILRDNVRLKNFFRDLFVKDSVSYSFCMQMISLNIFIKFYNADKDSNIEFKQHTASSCVEIMCNQLLNRDASVMSVNALCTALGWRGVSVSDMTIPQPSPYQSQLSKSQSKTSQHSKSLSFDPASVPQPTVTMTESPKSIETPTPHSTLDSLSVGNIVEFGRYPQDSDGTERPIKWKVLAVENGRALLFSEYGLDCVKYHHEKVAITWETCDLRRWLNNDFHNRAFSKSEQSKIAEVCLANADNSEYGTDGGNARMTRYSV